MTLVEKHDSAWVIIARWRKTKERPASKWMYFYRSIDGGRYPLFTTKAAAVRWMKQEGVWNGKYLQYDVVRCDVKVWCNVVDAAVLSNG